mgnify:CR=1 FL=1
MDVILKEPMSKRMNKGNEGEKQREKIWELESLAR